MKHYQGQCHCGKVQFEFQADIERVFTCNCSHCSIKGLVLTFLPETQFMPLQGEESLTEYRFYKKKLWHLFCMVCGVECFAKGEDPGGNKTVAVNLRTVPESGWENIPREQFNGKDF